MKLSRLHLRTDFRRPLPSPDWLVTESWAAGRGSRVPRSRAVGRKDRRPLPEPGGTSRGEWRGGRETLLVEGCWVEVVLGPLGRCRHRGFTSERGLPVLRSLLPPARRPKVDRRGSRSEFGVRRVPPCRVWTGRGRATACGRAGGEVPRADEESRSRASCAPAPTPLTPAFSVTTCPRLPRSLLR